METQIQHSERKHGNAEREHAKVEHEAVKQREQLRVIKSDLDKVVRAANTAQGPYAISCFWCIKSNKSSQRNRGGLPNPTFP